MKGKFLVLFAAALAGVVLVSAAEVEGEDPLDPECSNPSL